MADTRALHFAPQVGESPGYIPRVTFLGEVTLAFMAWEKSCGLRFVRVDVFEEATLKVRPDHQH